MKNLKKIVALVVAIAMISTLLVPAFANTFTYSDEARILYDLGLLKGESDTEYVPNLEAMLNRETGVTMLLRLFAEEEAALELTDEEAASKLAKFTDAGDVAGWAKKQVAYATDKGYVKGFPNGTFGPKQALNGKAYCSLILQMLGYDGDFDYHTAGTSLSQVGGLTAAEASKFNNDAGINRDSLAGISFGTLQAKYKGSEVTVIEKLIELGKVDEQLAKDKGVLKAKIVEVGELEDVTVKIGAVPAMPAKVEVTYDDETTAEVAVTWPTVDTTAAGEQEVEGTIAGTALKAKVKVIVQPDELLVTKVSATNLKEVVVEFNAQLDEDTVKSENIKVDGVAGTVELQDDKKTVIITVTNELNQQGEYTLIVEDVKDVTGVQIEKVEKAFVPFDGTRPEVVDIKVTGPDSLEIELSEPIKEHGDVELVVGSTTIGSGYVSGEGSRKITFEIWEEMKDGTTYEVTVKNFKDYANFSNIIKTIKVEYVKDAEPPVASITKVDQRYVKVDFTKPVKGLHAENFYHTFSAWEAKGIFKDEAMTQAIQNTDSVSTVWVKFADNADGDRPLADGRQKVGIRAKVDDVEVKDNWGNKFAAVEIEVTVTADREAPTVSSITVESERELKITFSKVVKFKVDNIEVLDTNGKEIDNVLVSVSPSTEEKEFTVDLGENLPGKTIVVKITDVEDTALQANKMAAYSNTIEITDKTAPRVTDVKYKEELNKPTYLYFFFNEDVTNTALAKANYALMDASGRLTNFDKTPSFAVGSNVVRIELTTGELDKLDLGYDIFVQRIADRAGNEMAGMRINNNEIVDIDNDPPVVEEIKATAKNRLVVTFNQRITGNFNKDAFEVAVGGVVRVISSITPSVNGDGNTVVTVNLKDEVIPANVPTNVRLSIVNNTSPFRSLLTNAFGVAAELGEVGLNAIDEIAPSYGKDDVVVNAGTAGNATVVITFNEDIKAGSVFNGTFAVRNNDVVGFNVTGNVVTLTLRDAVAAGVKVRVSQSNAVEDLAGNKYRNGDTIEVEAE